MVESIDTLVQRLNKIKEEKLKELDKLFESTDGCLDSLKKKEESLKNDIKSYFKKQKDFYFLEIEEDTDDKKGMEPDYDVLKNLNLGANERKAGMIESNRDTYNS